MNQRILIIALICLVTSHRSLGQRYPEVGKPFADFTLNNVKDHSKSSLTLSDFKGRFLILEFWNRYCSACLATFSETNKLLEKYNNKLDIILIGKEDKSGRTAQIYKKAKEKLNLRIPFTFDSTYYTSVVPAGAPHLVWIDNNGIVKAITTSTELNEANLNFFLEGKGFPFVDRSYGAKNRIVFDRDIFRPFFIDGNLGSDTSFLFRSVIARCNLDMQYIGMPESMEHHLNTSPIPLVQGCGTLEQLYRFAYTGYSGWDYGDPLYHEMYPLPQLELANMKDFMTNPVTRQGYYCYSLSVPPERATVPDLMKLMQSDLKEYFGYDVRIEKRKMPVYRLTASPDASEALKNKRADRSGDHHGWLGIRLTNITMSILIEQVFNKHIRDKPPIIDDTGINTKIDINLDANLWDLSDIRSQLEKIGLFLIEDEQVLNVIVISKKRL